MAFIFLVGFFPISFISLSPRPTWCCVRFLTHSVKRRTKWHGEKRRRKKNMWKHIEESDNNKSHVIVKSPYKFQFYKLKVHSKWQRSLADPMMVMKKKPVLMWYIHTCGQWIASYIYFYHTVISERRQRSWNKFLMKRYREIVGKSYFLSVAFACMWL